MLPGLAPSVPSAAALASLSYVTSIQGAGGDNAAQTYVAANIGAADPARYVIIVAHSIHNAGNRTATGCTVGGVAASLVGQVNGSAVGAVAIYALLVPTGTSASIVTSWSASSTSALSAIGIYRALNIDPAGFDTANSAVDPALLNIDTAAGGILIAGTSNRNGSTTAWTNITERYDFDTDTTDCVSGAGNETASAATSLAVSADRAAAGNGGVAFAVSFAPA